MKINHIILCISFTFSSWTLGLLITNAVRHKPWYDKLSNFNFIKSETVNKYMGIPLMRDMIRKSFWGKFNPTLKISKRPDYKELLILRNEMTCAETGHFIAFFSIIITAAVLWQLQKWPQVIVPLLVLNVPFNLYPSLLQQYNKRRLDKVLQRIKA